MKNSKKIAAWKVVTVKEYLEQKKNNPEKNTDWIDIVKKVEEIDPKVFVGVSNKNRKLSDFIKRNPEIVSMIEKELENDGNDGDNKYELKELVEAATKKNTGGATTAHINDEDSDMESESEVVPSAKLNEYKQNKDGSVTVDMEITAEDEKKLRDESYLLEKLGYDPLVWEIVSSSCRKGEWDAQIKGGKIKKLYSFRINANVKKREGSICESALLNSFLEHVESMERPKYRKITVKGENIAIISIADLHLGKLAWHKECGGNYDYKICKERYFYIINKAITYLKKIDNLEKVIFFWSQDFFHYDKLEVTTTAGTPQDTDVRWQKLYQIGCEMLTDGIELLYKELKVPVQTFYTRSNHDTQVSYYALQYLYAYFHNNPNVEVDRSPMGRKYVEYGINLMGFGHGDEEKKRIHQLMQVEEKEAWGRTLNHEYFLGHFHKQMVNDEGGVIARYLASPTETDAWHYTEGFVGALKQAQVFIRNKYEGPTDEFDINILE